MVDHHESGPVESEAPTGPVIRDKRRVDPETGAVRDPAADRREPQAGKVDGEADVAYSASDADAVEELDVPTAGGVHPDTTLAAERLLDLQRLQAEYVNYKRRVDRDHQVHRDVAISGVIEALLPVLDDIHLARQHGDLEGGPFAAIADKLEGTLTKFGVERFGEPGETFDPVHHEALMHVEAELAEGTDATTVVQVLQPGYRMRERIIRAARVAVADPQ